MADVRTPELVINKLSKQQYENIQNPSDTEIYLVREDEEHKPICYPTTASEVNATSMVVKSCVSDNGKILTENGFVYNTSGNPTVSDNKVVCDLGVGFMEKVLENLTMNTEYHIKSYGQNASGLVYGSELVQRTVNNPIPVEYQLVEYLETSSNQYITLNHILSTGDYYEFEFMILSSVNTTCMVVGATTTQQHYFTAYSGKWYFTNNNGIDLFYGTVDNIKHILAVNANGICLDGSVMNNGLVSTDNIPLNIGKRGTAVANSQRWYRFELNNYVGYYGANKCALYPVYRIADNKPGMYDLVNNVFYTNQGTGEFTVGPDKEWDD